MKILGIRCSNTDFAYVIIEGMKNTPEIVTCDLIDYPKGYKEHLLFHWFHQEITEILKAHTPDALVVKAAETMVRRSNPLETRIRMEGITLMTAGEAGLAAAHRKVKSTIAKDLGLKGKGKYLETELDTSLVLSFDSYDTKRREAILAAWSCLE